MTPIRTYAENSPQAVGRIVAMMMVADGQLAEAELAYLSDPEQLASIGIDAQGLRTVLADHLVDIALASPSPHEAKVNAPPILDQVLAPVTDPDLRLKACVLAVHASGADEKIDSAEHAVMHYMLQKWGLTLEDVHDYLAAHIS
ncbi:hypothetical protein GCM10025771_22550 [Niveibacterium umoris]|uniref:Putative tellurite resistance protein B-like protein n=1 Tax=Niveibacterium umoris TaxID=1193620 RepID=A0A840BNY3_9RHOO|nr:TerB family tellurite resistance protein [Niveibacterium umoris]MBB4012556.1 putative tellurite resistance protein B-like protein [Niveibacterium umoris]